MNLLNGFTGLFSLGQAGFMLLGAYAYAVLSIPVDKRAGVYQYFNGGIVKFSLPEVFSGIFGQNVGSVVGMIVALMIGGLIAALVAYLIGLPVLRLKSDYLAIATLGFAEIVRAFFQWNALGPLTNGSNLLKSYPDLGGASSYLILIGLFIAIILLLVNSTTDAHSRPSGTTRSRQRPWASTLHTTSAWHSSSPPSSLASAAACWPCTWARCRRSRLRAR